MKVSACKESSGLEKARIGTMFWKLPCVLTQDTLLPTVKLENKFLKNESEI